MRLQLFEQDGSSEDVILSAGDAQIDGPTHYVSFGGGRTEIRGETR